MKKLPWYKDGLKFKCTECGKCCTGSPGYVWVSENEMKEMAFHLGLSKESFMKKYTRRKNGRYALLEKHAQNFDCIFLEGKKCTIYEHRPKQCRAFPWWDNNLKSENDWKKAAEHCEGIHDDAPLVSYDEIAKQLNEPPSGAAAGPPLS